GVQTCALPISKYRDPPGWGRPAIADTPGLWAEFLSGIEQNRHCSKAPFDPNVARLDERPEVALLIIAIKQLTDEVQVEILFNRYGEPGINKKRIATGITN